jgi:hypothetical protein
VYDNDHIINHPMTTNAPTMISTKVAAVTASGEDKKREDTVIGEVDYYLASISSLLPTTEVGSIDLNIYLITAQDNTDACDILAIEWDRVPSSLPLSTLLELPTTPLTEASKRERRVDINNNKMFDGPIEVTVERIITKLANEGGWSPKMSSIIVALPRELLDIISHYCGMSTIAHNFVCFWLLMIWCRI